MCALAQQAQQPRSLDVSDEDRVFSVGQLPGGPHICTGGDAYQETVLARQLACGFDGILVSHLDHLVERADGERDRIGHGTAEVDVEGAAVGLEAVERTQGALSELAKLLPDQAEVILRADLVEVVPAIVAALNGA